MCAYPNENFSYSLSCINIADLLKFEAILWSMSNSKEMDSRENPFNPLVLTFPSRNITRIFLGLIQLFYSIPISKSGKDGSGEKAEIGQI